MAVQAKALTDVASLSLPVQNGDLFFVERSGTAAKLTAQQMRGPSLAFPTVTALIADSVFTYSNTPEGSIIITQGMTFRVAASGASNQHFTTAGGLKLYREDLENITVTVGSGGNFTTINAALEYLSGIRRGHKTGTGVTGVTATISLLTGFTMNEQVILRGVDMGWVTITAVDPAVTIVRSALTVRPTGSNNYAAFTGYENAVLPVIGAQFSMNSTGTATERGGVFVWKNSGVVVLPDCGVNNCGGRGLHVSDSSWATAREGEFTGCGDMAVRVSNSSTLAAEGFNGRTAGSIGIAMAGGSTAHVQNSFFSTSGGRPFSIEASYCYANSLTADGCTLAGQVYDGGILSGNGIIITNAVDDALLVYQGGHAAISNCDLGNAGNDALVVQDCSSVEAENGLFDSAGQDAVRMDHGSRGNFNLANLSGAGRYGLLCDNSSTASARSANASTAGTTGFRIDRGSFISCFGATGTLSTTKNVLTTNGAIFTDI
jgi:hypothetical protein